MRRIKILGLIVLLAVPLGRVQALGLGNVETHSVLNQPFEARIPIVQATAEEMDSLTVRLAGNDQFARAGIERAPVLSQLRFEIKQSGKGADYIRISTHDPVAEPFLNFLVEVNWAKGRFIREYTVLLDPPLYVPTQRLGAVKPATSAAAATSATAAAGTGEPWRSLEQPVYSAPGRPLGVTAPAGGVPAAGAETLWSAAAALRPDESISMAQMMLALLKANPDAFINGNVNLLKRGYINRLTVPDRQALTAVSREEALAEIKRQHELWQEYRQGGARTLPPQTAAETAAAPAPGGGEGGAAAPEKAAAAGGETDQTKLKLLAAKEGGGEAKAGETLALTREQLASKERENEELRSQLAESQQLVDTLKSRIALQDNQLAELQARLSQAPAAPPAPAAPAPTAEVKLPPPAEQKPAAAAEQRPAEQAAPAAEKPAPPPAAAAAKKPEGKPTEAVPAETKEAAAEPAQKKKKSPLEKKARVPTGPSWVDEVWTTLSGIWDNARGLVSGLAGGVQGLTSSISNVIPKTLADRVPGGLPGLFGGVVVVVAVVIALVRGIARRARGAGARPAARVMERAVSEAEEETVRAGETTDYGEEITRQRADQTEVPATEAGEKTQIAMPSGTAAAAAPVEEDPLSEVNVYLAYERFDEAEKVVKDAIAKHPNEHKFKLRLLEVYYAASNKAAYENAARALKNAVGEGSPLWDSALAMWREMSPDRELFAAGGAEELTTATAAARQFVDITGASAGGTGALGDTIMMAPGSAPVPEAAGGAGLDIDLGVGGETGATTTADTAVLDLTAAQPVPEDALSLTAADNTGMLDLSGGGVEAAAMAPDLSATVDRSLGGAPPAGGDLLDVTKSGMGQTLGATPAGADDLLDVTKTGDVSGIEGGDLLNVSTSKETAKADEHVIEFDLGGGTAAPAAKPDEEEIEVRAPETEDQGLEFDLGAAGAAAEEGGLSLDLSDSGLTGGKEEGAALSLEPAESPELTLDVSGGGASPAMEKEDGLDLDLSASDLSAEGEGASLDELAKSMEETVAGLKQEPAGATELPELDLSLEPATEEKEMDFDSTQELERDAMAKARAHADVGNEQTVVMPRTAPVDAQSAAAEVDTKLSLAKAYIELGDSNGARTILNEVVAEGNATQKAEAQRLLQTI